jgi:hypothetical protein
MNSLTQFFVQATKQWWVVVLIFFLNFASFRILFGLEHRFTQLTGTKVFDTQNDLTAQKLLEQLPTYTGEARPAYNAFAAFDYLFPLVAAVFLVVLWTLLLKVNPNKLAKGLLHQNFSLLPFSATLFDWLENLSIAGVLQTSDNPNMFLVNLVIIFKRLKLASLGVTGLLTIALILFTAITLLLKGRMTR